MESAWRERSRCKDGGKPHRERPLILALDCKQDSSMGPRVSTKKLHEQLCGSVLCPGSGDLAGVAKVQSGNGRIGKI